MIGEKMKEIKVHVIRSYGNDFLYPNCELSNLICELTRRKTIVQRVERILTEFGYTISKEVKDD